MLAVRQEYLGRSGSGDGAGGGTLGYADVTNAAQQFSPNDYRASHRNTPTIGPVHINKHDQDGRVSDRGDPADCNCRKELNWDQPVQELLRKLVQHKSALNEVIVKERTAASQLVTSNGENVKLKNQLRTFRTNESGTSDHHRKTSGYRCGINDKQGEAGRLHFQIQCN